MENGADDAIGLKAGSDLWSTAGAQLTTETAAVWPFSVRALGVGQPELSPVFCSWLSAS